MAVKTKEAGLGLDQDRLVYRTGAILDKRDQYFMDMINAFKRKYPGVKVIYANSAPGATFDQFAPKPDFVFIVRGRLVSNDPKLPPKDIIMYDMPMLFTERSIAGWTLAVEAGKRDAYFEYMMDTMCRIEAHKFSIYLKHMALLSTDPNSELYWRKAENTDKLVKELAELYARYSTQDQRRRIKAVSGYGTKPHPAN